MAKGRDTSSQLGWVIPVHRVVRLKLLKHGPKCSKFSRHFVQIVKAMSKQKLLRKSSQDFRGQLLHWDNWVLLQTFIWEFHLYPLQSGTQCVTKIANLVQEGRLLIMF
jgi:glutaredoxin-related protein